jgi:hypothetical protein
MPIITAGAWGFALHNPTVPTRAPVSPGEGVGIMAVVNTLFIVETHVVTTHQRLATTPSKHLALLSLFFALGADHFLSLGVM